VRHDPDSRPAVCGEEILEITGAAKHDSFEVRVVDSELGEDREAENPEKNAQNDVAPIKSGYSRHEE
jgi:hypothetical protein